MSYQLNLSADDLAGLRELRVTGFTTTEAAVSLYYDEPEQVERFAERHGMPVEIDPAHEVDGIGIFHTVSVSETCDGIDVFAVGSRALAVEGVGAVFAR